MLALVFTGARAYAAFAGVRFDATPFQGFWHLVDADLLRTRLFESIFYLHSQPPLFNLWLGLYAKLFGDALASAFAITYLALGVLHASLLVRLARALGLRGLSAFVPAALFCASPAVLLYENFLLYSYPVLVLLSGSAYLLFRALELGRSADLWALAANLAAIVLMRSLFHPLFLLCVALGCLIALRRARVLLPFAIACMLVLAVLIKNAIVFGSFAISSWGGMSLARVVLDRTPVEQRSALVARGALSEFSLVSGFKALDRYPLSPAQLAPTGVPLLDRPRKLDGQPNFHHRAFVNISQTLARDAASVVRETPSIYLASLRENLAQSGKSSWTYRPLAAQKRHIARYVTGFSRCFGWFPGLGATHFPTLLALAGYGLWSARRARGARAGLSIYLSACALYVVLIGAMFERSENQRFRLLVDPSLLLLASHALHTLVARVRAALAH